MPTMSRVALTGVFTAGVLTHIQQEARFYLPQVVCLGLNTIL